MVKCPYCGEEFGIPEFLRHVEIHKATRAEYAIPSQPPRGRYSFDIPPVLKAAIGSMFRERAKYWYDLIDRTVKTYKAKGMTYEDAKEEMLKFQWAFSELNNIAEELGLEQGLLNEIDRMRSASFATGYIRL